MLIGITGAPVAGSGKDTVADLLVSDWGFVKVSLADPMKRFCKELFNFSDEQMWGASSLRNAPDERYVCTNIVGEHLLTPRVALQQLGTNWGRSCYQDVWIDYAAAIYKKLSAGDFAYSAQKGVYYCKGAGPRDVVVPDIRFDNEARGLSKHGARVWCVKRPVPKLEGAAGCHVSESGISAELIDVTLHNDKGLDELTSLVAMVVKEVVANEP
jgi:hypothetical protein